MTDKEKAESGQGIVRYSTGGVFDSVDLLARAIQSLSEKHNLIVPGGAVGKNLPLLHSAGVSFVFIDLKAETYGIPGSTKLGVGKTALDRIAAAAGVRWNPHLCGRVDDGTSPYVVEYQVFGTVQQLDSTERPITAVKRIDLRAEKQLPVEQWGTDAQEIARIAAKAKDSEGNPAPRDPWPQIIQARQHILSLAESKAKNRAIRSLGVRTAYAAEDLAKGFAVVKLQFTGQSKDPEIEREVSLMIAQRALSSTSLLYNGKAQLASRSVPRVITVEAEEAAEEEQNGGSDESVENEPEEKPATKPSTAGEAAAQALAQVVPQRVCPKDDPQLICGDKNDAGTWPKKPCSEFSTGELRAKIAAYEKKRPKWDPKWAAKNEKELSAMKAWLAYKEFDPRQGTIPRTGQESDEVPI